MQPIRSLVSFLVLIASLGIFSAQTEEGIPRCKNLGVPKMAFTHQKSYLAKKYQSYRKRKYHLSCKKSTYTAIQYFMEPPTPYIHGCGEVVMLKRKKTGQGNIRIKKKSILFKVIVVDKNQRVITKKNTNAECI